MTLNDFEWPKRTVAEKLVFMPMSATLNMNMLGLVCCESHDTEAADV